jgi:hypothetical protein
MEPTDPVELRRVKPSVVFMTDDVTSERVEVASHVLTFAAVADNSSVFYANATTFEHFTQRIGGEPGGYARRTRRLHGSGLNGSMVHNVLDAKPAWCGSYQRHNARLAHALEAVIFTDEAKPIREALRAVMGALTDADSVDSRLERSLFARAAEMLLHRDGDPRNGRAAKQEQRGKALLRPLLELYDLDFADPNIMKVWNAVRRDRNGYWHPEADDGPEYPFEKQIVVHFNLIAFHMIEALIIATLVALGSIEKDSKLKAFVPGIEHWISQIVEADSREPGEASNLGVVVAHYAMKRAIEDWIAEYPDHDSFAKAHPEGETAETTSV